MKKNILFFLFIIPIFLTAQKEDNFIHWKAGERLTWNDFKGSAVKTGDVAALTATHLGFSYNVVNGKISFTIECKFEKDKSWGLVKNDWILKHEQGHFDIAEIFARKLHRAVAEYIFNRETFQKDLDRIYSKIVDEKEIFQQQYDDDTNYSRNKAKQEEWLNKIVRQLKELTLWAAYK